MFAIVPIVIAIGLIAILAFVMIDNTGGFFTDSSDQIKASSAIKESSHILSAKKIYRLENFSEPSDLNTLMSDTRYNSSGTDLGWTYDATTGMATKPVENDQQCILANEALNYSGPVPSCSSVPSELSSKGQYCCSQ